MINYREFTCSDIKAVLEMWKNTPGVKLHENGEDSIEGISMCINRNPGLSFIAESEGKIVAAVLNGQDGRRGYIYHLVVEQSYRRLGIASKLLELTQSEIKNQGIHKLALFVLNDNIGAQKFYEAEKWNTEDIVKIFAKIL